MYIILLAATRFLLNAVSLSRLHGSASVFNNIGGKDREKFPNHSYCYRELLNFEYGSYFNGSFGCSRIELNRL